MFQVNNRVLASFQSYWPDSKITVAGFDRWGEQFCTDCHRQVAQTSHM